MHRSLGMVDQFTTLTKHYSSSDRFARDLFFRHGYVGETFNFSFNWWRDNTSDHEVVAAFVILFIVGNVCPSVIFICKSLSCRVSSHMVDGLNEAPSNPLLPIP